MKNKTAVLSFILLMICGLVWAQTPLDEYYGELSQKEIIQPIDFCFKISSPTENITMELLFGTCANIVAGEVNTTLPPGTVSGSNPVDYYFLYDSQAWDVLFTENRLVAQWTLNINAACTLLFSLPGGTAPKAGSSLEFFQGESKLGDIVSGGQFEALIPGQYTIKYTPAPEKSEVAAEVTYIFQPGWNLLHLPIVVYDNDRREGDKWAELNALPRMTLSGRTYVKGDEIRCGEAFWVFYEDGLFTGNTLTVLGYEPLVTDWPARQAGWNFQGKQSDNTANIIYQWGNRQYQQIDADEMVQEQGYWLNR